MVLFFEKYRIPICFTEDNLIEENSRVIDAIERHISDNVNLIDILFEYNETYGFFDSMFLLTNIFKDYSNFRNVQEYIVDQIKSEGKYVDSYFFWETTDLGYPLPTINELKDAVIIMIFKGASNNSSFSYEL